jgi:hypothetical protein
VGFRVAAERAPTGGDHLRGRLRAQSAGWRRTDANVHGDTGGFDPDGCGVSGSRDGVAGNPLGDAGRDTGDGAARFTFAGTTRESERGAAFEDARQRDGDDGRAEER